MSRFSDDLEEILSPVRDLYLSRYLRRVAKSRKIGHEIVTEPRMRDKTGAIDRDGVLNLPRRSDFGLVTKKGVQHRDIGEICDMMFDPMEFDLSRDATIRVYPFCWKAFEVAFDAEDDPDRLQLVRHWYLEWFQARRLEDAEDIAGAVHSLDGPEFNGKAWSIRIDMGSAPIAAFADLMDVLVASGARHIRVGSDRQFAA